MSDHGSQISDVGFREFGQLTSEIRDRPSEIRRQSALKVFADS